MKKLLTLFTCGIFFSVSSYGQYCIPNDNGGGCGDGDDINTFILFGQNGTQINDINTGCAPFGAYEDFTALSVDLSQGESYIATISTEYTGTQDNVAIWIDFNDDEVFDSSEQVAGEYDLTVAGIPVTITIPPGSTLGSHRMRVFQQYAVDPFFMDPCNAFDDAYYYESHDYSVNIVPPPSCPTPNTVSINNITDVSMDISWAGIAPLYSVEYGPQGFTPGTGTYQTTATNNLTISGLTANTDYSVYIRALCSPTDSSSLAMNNVSSACGFVDPPYIQNFDSETLYEMPDCMVWEDANGDGSGWQTSDVMSFSGFNSIVYWATWNVNGDDWFFTPGINMVAGSTYEITFKYSASFWSSFEALEVKGGTGPSSADMGSTVYFTNNNITNTSYQTASFIYTAPITGPNYIGWHCTSDAYSDFLSIEDINIVSTCVAPTNVVASNITMDGADITWDPTTSGNYQYILDENPGDPSTVGVGTTATSYTVTGLLPSTTYYFHIRSDCGNEYSMWETISFTTSNVACGTPANVTTNNLNSYSADMSWDAVTGAMGYEYVLDQLPGNPAGNGTGTAATSYTASALTPNTTYYFHVRANCILGFSNWATVSFTTPAAPCNSSGSLTANNVTDVSANMVWTVVSGANGYEYVLDELPADPTGPGTFTAFNTHLAVGLTPNTTYHFHLRTSCGSDASPWTSVSFTTLSDPAGVNNVNGDNTMVSVFPNPVNNAAIVEIANAGDNAQIQLTDISGRILQTIAVKDGKAEIDMADLTAGMYLIKYSDDAHSQLIKIVKQ